ncbi:MAG: hypothetical protein HQM16_06275 [Deltaproteobacteria bacterium]|nr:hypothetical protein [Deltaproteobacteria bacterium]
MKRLFVIFGLILFFSQSTMAGVIPLEKLEAQAVSYEFGADGSLTIVGEDPVLIIPVNGDAEKNNLLTIEYKRRLKHNKMDMVFGWERNGKKGQGRMKLTFAVQQGYKKIVRNLKSHPQYRGNIQYLALIFVGRDEKVDIKSVGLDGVTAGNFFTALYYELFGYTHFIPSDVNLVAWPTLNGILISKPFVALNLLFVVVAGLLCCFLKQHNSRRRVVKFVFMMMVFSWCFIDFVCSINQARMYRLMTAVLTPIENARNYGVFTDFLDFIRQNTIKGSRGVFIVPYANNIEGPYHIYPHIKQVAGVSGGGQNGAVKGLGADYYFVSFVQGLGWYAPPVYDQQGKELIMGNHRVKIKKVIPFNDVFSIFEVDQ